MAPALGRTSRHRYGFTLVELSIVLVILGLLVGGVLAGQSLIRAAEMRAVSTEYTSYMTALGAFRDKYFALPGDMPNAVRYWGAQAGATTDGANATCSALYDAPATGTLTCNGDGNGTIGPMSGSTNLHERVRAWQHLANAGLIEGSYAGAGVGGAGVGVPGQNIPRSRLVPAAWSFASIDITGIPGIFFPGDYRNMFIFSNPTTGAGLLKGEEAYNIDMKLDDGKPQSGIMMAQRSASNPACVAATNDTYNLSDNTKGCAGLFFMTRN